MKKVSDVYVFKNGMAMVFDYQGEQIPQLQGRWSEKREEIESASDVRTRWHHDVDWEEYRKGL